MFWIIKLSLHWPKFSHVILLLLLLYLAWTANQGCIPYGYLHVLVQSHQGSLLCVLDTLLFFTRCAEESRVWISSLYLKNFMEKETRGQEVPKWSKLRHSWRPFSEPWSVTLKCQSFRIYRVLVSRLNEFYSNTNQAAWLSVNVTCTYKTILGGWLSLQSIITLFPQNFAVHHSKLCLQVPQPIRTW